MPHIEISAVADTVKIFVAPASGSRLYPIGEEDWHRLPVDAMRRARTRLVGLGEGKVEVSDSEFVEIAKIAREVDHENWQPNRKRRWGR